MNSLTYAGVASLAVMALVPSAGAQQTGSRQTREFVQAAGQSDQFEILEAQTVLGQSADAQVRALAEQMVREHDQLRHALSEATTRAGIEPPSMGISTDQAQLLNALQSQRGRDFDETYVKHQALAHRAALLVEQTYAAAGDNQIVRQVAMSASPTIAAHLDMAEKMHSQLAGL